MLKADEDRESRRPTILEGIGMDLTYSEIAAQLGVKKWTVRSDIRRMQHEGDVELRQVYQKKKELKKANRHMLAKKQEKRFFGMMGMTIDEKMFQNMVHYHKNELRKVLQSRDESAEISKLSRNVRKTLERNEIINHGYGKYEITTKARDFLASREIHERRERNYE